MRTSRGILPERPPGLVITAEAHGIRMGYSYRNPMHVMEGAPQGPEVAPGQLLAS